MRCAYTGPRAKKVAVTSPTANMLTSPSGVRRNNSARLIPTESRNAGGDPAESSNGTTAIEIRIEVAMNKGYSLGEARFSNNCPQPTPT